MTLRGLPRPQPAAAFRPLCVITHHVVDRLGPGVPISDVLDEVKWACARARLDYDRAPIREAVEAVHTARQKGYKTPRRRRES